MHSRYLRLSLFICLFLISGDLPADDENNVNLKNNNISLSADAESDTDTNSEDFDYNNSSKPIKDRIISAIQYKRFFTARSLAKVDGFFKREDQQREARSDEILYEETIKIAEKETIRQKRMEAIAKFQEEDLPYGFLDSSQVPRTYKRKNSFLSLLWRNCCCKSHRNHK